MGYSNRIASGVYTPVINNSTNTSTLTAHPCQYLRVGSVVTVSGGFTLAVTASGQWDADFSLPPNTAINNFAAAYQCGGCGSGELGGNDTIIFRADTGTTHVKVDGFDNDTSDHEIYFSFTFQIV